MIRRFLLPAALCLAAISIASCSGKKEEEGHGLKGEITGAREGAEVILEAANDLGRWYAVDTAEISDGKFFLPYDVPEEPDIYRVNFGGKYVYVPVDSSENLVLKSSAAAFDKDFRLSGSRLAERFTAFEHDAMRVEALANPDSTEALRRRAYDTYIKDAKGDILSYYIVARPYAGGFLIDYTDPIFSAVATAYQTYRPNDRRTASLVEAAKRGQAERRVARGQRRVIQAPESAIIDLDLPDTSGKRHMLSQIVGRGKPTVLLLTSMKASATPEVHRVLRSIYEAGQADVFEVAYDTDHLVIGSGAKGLPWTVVYDPDGLDAFSLVQYNVSYLPTMFIYDSNGELKERAADIDQLRRLLPTVK